MSRRAAGSIGLAGASPAAGGGALTDAFRVAGLPWLVSRAVVLSSLELARYLVGHTHPAVAGVAARAHEGLLGWDAGYYRDIAARGYTALPRDALRFFPLVPLVTRAIHVVTRIPVGPSLLIVANGSALLAGALLYRLAVAETGDRALGRRAVWLLALAPSAFVLVMGYAEATLLVFGVLVFLGLRSRRWWLAAAAGYLAALTRPIGVLIALPAAVAAWSDLRAARRAERPARVAAVLGPVAGLATYLGYAAWRFGDFLLPLRVQLRANLRGTLSNPVTTVAHDIRGLSQGHVGTALHVPWLALLLVLLGYSFRRWGAVYGLYAAVVLAAAISSSNLDSLERYALSAFPFVLAGASLTARPRVDTSVVAVFGAALLGYSLLAFLNAFVP